MKRLLTFVVILTLAAILIPGVKAASAQEAVQFIVDKNSYYVDGSRHLMDATTFIENGRTYVPLRFMGEALGAHVDWNGLFRMVTLTKGRDKIVHLVVGVNKILVINESDALLDTPDQFFGRASDIDVPPLSRNGRTYLPARFVAEALGYKVNWDAPTGTVTISKAGATPPPPPVVADPFNPPIEWIKTSNENPEHPGRPTIKVETAQKLFGPLVPPEKLIGKNVTAFLREGSRDVLLSPEIRPGGANPPRPDKIVGGTLLKNYLSVPYKMRHNEYVEEWRRYVPKEYKKGWHPGKLVKEEKMSLPLIDMLKLEGFPEQNIFWDPKRKIMVIYGAHSTGQPDRYRVIRMIPGHEYSHGARVPALIVENGVPVIPDDTLGGISSLAFWESGIGKNVFIDSIYGIGYLFK